VDEVKELNDLYKSIRAYLSKNYGDIVFGAATVKFDPVYDLTEEQILSEFNSRVDYTDRTIFVEIDNPINNVRVAILRGLISLWQSDSSLANQYAMAQLYFEELKYWRSLGQTETADWIHDHLPADVCALVEEITDYVNFKDLITDTPAVEETTTDDATTEDATDDTVKESEADDKATKDDGEDTDDKGTPTPVPSAGEHRTSFTFMREKAAELRTDAGDGEELLLRGFPDCFQTAQFC
jgi:hypothetical protein